MSQSDQKQIVNVRHSQNGKLTAKSKTWNVPPSKEVTAKTNRSANRSVSKGTGMDAGHDRATSHNGAGDASNLNLTNRNLNRGVQQKNEVAATKAANQGKNVQMTRTAIFDRNNPMTVKGKAVPRAFLADKTTVNGVPQAGNKVVAHINKTTPEARKMAGIQPRATPAKVIKFPASAPPNPTSPPPSTPAKARNPLSAARPVSAAKPRNSTALSVAKPAANPLSAAKPASPPPAARPSGGVGGRAGGK